MFKWLRQKTSNELNVETLQLLLDKKMRVEKAMVEIAPLFRSIEREEIAVKKALKHLVAISGCTRAYVMAMKDENTMFMKYEHCNKFVVPIKHFLKSLPYKEYGWFRDQVILNGYVDVPNTADVPPEAEEVKEVFKRGRMGAMLSFSFASKYKFNGTLVLTNTSPIEKWDADVILLGQFVASLMENLNERIYAEKQLTEALERVKASDNLKTTFINNISHEVRTPLNGILGFSQIIANSDLSKEKQMKLSEVIQQNSTQLLSIMSDLMDISMVDSDSMDFFFSNISLKEFIKSVYKKYSFKAQKNADVSFKLQFDVELDDVIVSADRERLEQLLSYLLDNAFKFTHKGTVTLYCRRGGPKIEIGVSDTGIGIAKKDQKDIYERFWQASNNLDRMYGGNGLGLSLAKAVADKLKYNLECSSRLEKGSDFVLQIDYVAINHDVPLDVPNALFKSPKKLLLIDDFDPVHDYVNKICSSARIECVCASSGIEGLREYENFNYDVVLLDIKMEGMDGFQTLKHLKDINPNVIVIAQTAHFSPDDKKMFLKEGFSDVLLKPYIPAALLNSLKHVLSDDFIAVKNGIASV